MRSEGRGRPPRLGGCVLRASASARTRNPVYRRELDVLVVSADGTANLGARRRSLPGPAGRRIRRGRPELHQSSSVPRLSRTRSSVAAAVASLLLLSAGNALSKGTLDQTQTDTRSPSFPPRAWARPSASSSRPWAHCRAPGPRYGTRRGFSELAKVLRGPTGNT